MSRVSLTFGGNSRGAVTAAKEVVAEIARVKEAAAVQARDNIVQRVQERESLERLAAEYTRVASTAKRGSEVQLAAAKLEISALRELNDVHGVTAKHTSNSTKELEKFSKGAVVGSGALGHFSRSVALASAPFLGGLGFIAVAKTAISQGSALEKQLERTTKTFGLQAAGIKEWSKTSATALGLARSDALDAANTIGTLLDNMGVAPAKAADMSKSITQLASDMAAFKGVKPEDALAALEAGLQGRTRTLKQFGIVLDQTTIKQEAERQGLIQNTVDLGKVRDAEIALQLAQYHLNQEIDKHGAKSAEAAKATIALHNAEDQLAKARAGHAEAITNEQKALATYSLLMQQTSNQQGTWAKRSHDLAGQSQILHAQIKDLEEELGTALLPVLEKYLPMLTHWIKRNEENGNFQRDFNKAVHLGTDAVTGIVAIVKVAKKIFDELATVVGGDKNAFELLAGVLVGKKMIGAFATTLTAAKDLRVALLALGDSTVIGALGGVAAALWIAKDAYDAIHNNAKERRQETVVSSKNGTTTYTKAGHAYQQTISYAGGPPITVDITNTPEGRAALRKAQTIQATAPNTSGHTNDPASDAAGGNRTATTGIVQTALGTVGTPYQWGGAPSLTKPTDCSGLMVAVFQKNGIALPRTSQEQFAQAPIRNAKPLLPGDLVFSEGVHPGHVGLYIGNNEVLEDPHTGDHVKVIALSAFGWNGESARWWGGSKKTTGGGTTTDTTGTSFTEKPKSTTTGLVTGTKLLSQGAQLALAHAAGTAGVADNLAALKEARAELEKLQQTASKKEQVPIAAELASVNKQINAIDAAKAKSRLEQIAKAHAETAKKVKASIDAQTRAWDTHVQHLKAIADQTRQQFQDKWSTAANAVMRAFDKATQAGLNALAAPGQTAAEKAAADFRAAHAAAATAATLSGLQSGLADALAAQSAGVGDTTGMTADQITAAQKQLNDNVVSAQQSLDDELYQEQQQTLDDAATLSRDAADAKATADQQAYQDQRDLQRDELQKWLDEQEQKLEDGRTQWDAFFADLQAMASAGGFDVGTAFWQAWNDAAAAYSDSGSASSHLQSVTAGGPLASGSDTMQALHEAAVSGQIDAATYQYLLQGRKLDIPGFAAGGFADSRPRSVDPRDTILARLRKGEYVMTPEEVAAGGPSWSGRTSGGTHLHGDVYVLGASKHEVQRALADLAANGQERRIGYTSPRN